MATEISRTPNPPERGIQIPSRPSALGFSFSLPKILLEAGITKAEWRLFVTSIRQIADLDVGQCLTVYLSSVGITLGGLPLLGPGAFPLGFFTCLALNKKCVRTNLVRADSSGIADELMDRWNLCLFEPLGLHAKLQIPGSGSGSGSIENMDVTTTRLFKYREKKGLLRTPKPNQEAFSDPKELKYQNKELKEAAKALRKTRVVILPLDLVPPEARASQSPQPATRARIGNIERPTDEKTDVVEPPTYIVR